MITKQNLTVFSAFFIFVVLSMPVFADTVQLKQGWNHVSGQAFPFQSTTCEFEKPWNVIYWYSPLSREWVPMNHSTDFAERSSLHSYFVKVASDCSITYTPSQRYGSIRLYRGWNLIRGFRDAEVASGTGRCDRGTAFYSWNISAMRYNIHSGVNDLNTLQEGRGYWVYIGSESCMLSKRGVVPSQAQCPAPAGVACTRPTSDRMEISWSQASGATGYRVDWMPADNTAGYTIVSGTRALAIGVSSAVHTAQVKSMCENRDSDSAIASCPAYSAVAAGAGTLTSTNVQSLSLIAGANTTVDVNFTTANPMPANGTINVTFGAGFVLGGVNTTTALWCPTMDGTFNVSVSGQTVMLIRNADGTSQAAGSAESCKINGTINPATQGSTGTYSIKTIGSNILIDQDNAVAADTIVAAAADAQAPTVTVTHSPSGDVVTQWPVTLRATVPQGVSITEIKVCLKHETQQGDCPDGIVCSASPCILERNPQNGRLYYYATAKNAAGEGRDPATGQKNFTMNAP